MKITYDPETDTLTIRLKEAHISESDELQEGIIADFDRLGNMVGFELLPGQRHDTIGVAALIEGRHFDGLIADKAFDVNWIVEELDGRGAEIVISQHPNRVAPRNIDTEGDCRLYRKHDR